VAAYRGKMHERKSIQGLAPVTKIRKRVMYRCQIHHNGSKIVGVQLRTWPVCVSVHVVVLTSFSPNPSDV